MKTAKQRSLSQNKEKIILNWITYLTYVDKLVKLIKKSKIKLNYIYGVPRGGLIPATIISHQLNLKLFDHSVFPKEKDVVLIVDDICDTGKTLKPFIDLNTSTKRKIVTATIFKHSFSPIRPDFYVETNEKWIVFPYEKD